MIDLSAFTKNRSHSEAYRALYDAFCAERGLEVETGTDDWPDADSRAWRILVAALAEAYE